MKVTAYKVFISGHLRGDWSLIAEVPAVENPSITLNHADYDSGSYDFAVSVMRNSYESPLHTSLDFTAYPYGGWFLVWQ